MRKWLIVAAMAVSLWVGAVPALAQGEEETTTTSPPTTEETQPADTTEAPDGSEETPWWILIIVGVSIVVLLVAVARAGRSKQVYVAAPDPGWKPNARGGYADARWLLDAMTEDLAIWRGNAQYDGTTEVGATADSAKAETWTSLAARLDSARTSLYRLEAAAPDARTARTAQSVVAALNSTRTALDNRAQARHHHRTVESASGPGSSDLAEARDRELRTAQNLAAARRALGDSLTQLSALT